MASQRRDAAIVGIHEYPSRNTHKTKSQMQIKAESAYAALEDSGLKLTDVDAIYDAAEVRGMSGVQLSEYFGIKPTVIDTTSVGGASYEYHAAHAARDIAAGKAKVALLTYGSTALSDSFHIGTGGARGRGRQDPISNMELTWGKSTIASYAMAMHRHMYQYGTTAEQFAEIAAVTRTHAMRNPEAVQAMQDLGFEDIRDVSVQDVLNSPMIADPLHRLECCMISDGGGAVVIASPEVARDCKHKPVWIIGSGEATGYLENTGDITVSAGAQSAPLAFAEAGVRPEEMDIAMLYDSFTITVMMLMEDIGLCKKGDGGKYVQPGRFRWDSGIKPALNTDGGGLSSNHPGGRGLFLLLESARQLRGDSTSQVAEAALAVAHGNGGELGGHHCGGTVILAKD